MISTMPPMASMCMKWTMGSRTRSMGRAVNSDGSSGFDSIWHPISPSIITIGCRAVFWNILPAIKRKSMNAPKKLNWLFRGVRRRYHCRPNENTFFRGVPMSNLTHVLTAKAIEIGKLAVRSTTAAGSGHPSTALSLAHITAVLMYHTMRWDPTNPASLGSDRLVLSEGHAVPIIYAAAADLGVTIYHDGKPKRMTTEDLLTLRDIKSPIDGHPNPQLGFPFFDAATGSLGQGLSVAGGLALRPGWISMARRFTASWATANRERGRCGRRWILSPIKS